MFVAITIFILCSIVHYGKLLAQPACNAGLNHLTVIRRKPCPAALVIAFWRLAMVLPDIRLLQSAIALAEELNYSRAAERLHIEQSTLSRQIFKLEEQIHLRVFIRNHQNVDLTEAGRRFIEDARDIVQQTERAIREAMSVSRGASEVLNIGKSAYTDPYLVTTVQSIPI
jgi:hypothetical protein